MSRLRLPLLIGLIATFGASCQAPEPAAPPRYPPPPDPGPTSLDERPLPIPPQPVDFSRLRALLPGTLPGYEQTGIRGERQPMGAFAMTQARATYARGGQGGADIVLSVADGGEPGRLVEIGAVWLNREVEQEGLGGYERTTRFEGFPAYERLDQRPNGSRAELQFVVADRFFVSATGASGTGAEASLEELRRAAAAIDLRALAAFAAQGAEP